MLKGLLKLILAGAVALFVRLFYLQFIQIDWDGYFYLFHAQSIAVGDFLSPSPHWTIYPPGYSTLIALASTMADSMEASALLVSLLSGIGIVVVSVWAALRWNGIAALFLAALLILDPVLIRYSVSVLSESLFTFVLVLLMMYWLPTMDGEMRRFDSIRTLAVSLGLIAVLVSVRSIGLVLLIPFVLVFVGTGLRQMRAALVSLAVTGAVAIFFVQNWYSGAVGDVLVTSQGYVDSASTVGYAIQEMSRGLRLWGYPATDTASPGEFLSSNGNLLARMWVLKAIALISNGPSWTGGAARVALLPYWALFFVGIGTQALYTKSRRRVFPWLPVLSLMIFYLLPLPLFVDSARYYVPLLPALWFMSAFGLARMTALALDKAWAPLASRTFALGLFSLLVLWLALTSYRYLPHERTDAINPWEVAGRWIAENLQSSVVITQHPSPAYYADADIVWWKPDSVESPDVQSRSVQTLVAVVRCRDENADGTSSTTPVNRWRDAGWNLAFRTETGAFSVCVHTLAADPKR